ncbi:coiled-coil domain-containing protein 40 isoform X2 [Aethina tumida]|uniref:coiled-coil domain-containing protein 40 isoform X2 n=1 Tax=Aethina tumida TaxID=116153 RepID=UPI00214989F8|nr:coiled-coil domain-containing protein 40 isoform X2 [Aethina tumida]
MSEKLPTINESLTNDKWINKSFTADKTLATGQPIKEDKTVKNVEVDIAQLPVLDPNHPMLERFQKALKEQLLIQIDTLKSEVHEYNIALQRKREERDSVGVRSYEAQQVLCKQQAILEESAETLDTITKAREELQEKLEEERTRHKEVREKLFQSEKTVCELRGELEATNLLVQQMTEWETRIESNITVNQRIAEKTRKDNTKLAVEKRRQDAVIYKLMKEIWRLESELETMDMQLRVKESEREEMAEMVSQGNANIDVIQAEHRCLIHSWNSVVVAVGNRDKVLGCLRDEAEKLDLKSKAIQTEIEQVKKLIKSELAENESHTLNKYKLNVDINNYKSRTQDEMMKYKELQTTLYELTSVSDRISKDIDIVQAEQKQKEAALNILLKDIQTLCSKKLQKEQEITKLIDVLVLNDKSAQNMHLKIKKQQQINRNAEIKLADLENQHINLSTNIDRKKFELARIQEQHGEISAKNEKLVAEDAAIRIKIDALDVAIRKKQAELEGLNNKLEKARDPGLDMGSPQDLKIVALEKSVDDMQENIKNLQTYWLREQKNLLTMSKDRQEQIHDTNLLKKQVIILEQKNFKISDDIDREKMELENLERRIRKLQSKVVILCDSLFKKKDRKNEIDNTNDILKNHYDIKLKDAELECLRIQAETAELENEKVTLSKDLLDLNRQILEWEKKIIMTKETKENIKESQSESGELATMKSEVHRMKVRYSQLKKAQEKLVTDLEQCVVRRTSLFLLTDAAEKKTGENKSKYTYAKKIQDLSNKLKKTENEIEDVQRQIDAINNEAESINKSKDDIDGDIAEIKKEAEQMMKETETMKTNRQLKFELLLMQQKKLALYTELSKGRTPYTVCRTQEQLTSEYSKQKDVNNKLTKIVENLTSDFPDFSEVFTRIFNTLRLPHVIC